MGSGYGQTVIDGEIQYLSPSGMTTGDPKQPGGCLRRWLYKYVMRLKEPFTGAQKLGVETHGQIERYQLTGEKVLGRLALSAQQFIPEPMPDLYSVEHVIQPGELFVAGIRVVGHIDLVRPWSNANAPGLSAYINQFGDWDFDPRYTVELLDWKTTSDVNKWAKTGPQLIDTIQMPLYGQWAVENYPEAQHVRLSHVYMQTKGKAMSRKATILMDRAKLARRWEQIEGVARSLIDVAKETDVNKVPANRHACSAFRGCPRRDVCPADKADTLKMVFGRTKANLIQVGEKQTMSIEDELNALSATAAPASVPAPIPAPVPAAPANTLVTTDNFKAAIAVIEDSGKGFPNLSGHEAQAYKALKGLKEQQQAVAYDITAPNGTSYRITVEPSGDVKGAGDYGTLSTLSFDQVLMLGGQVKPEPVAAAPAPVADVGLVPPGAPVSDPANAAVPVAGFVKDETPAPAPEPAPAAPVAEAAPAPTAPEPAPTTGEKPNFKKLKSPQRLEMCEQLWGELQAAKAGAPAPAAAPTAEPEGLKIYINAIPSSPFDSLQEYIGQICRSLEQQTGARDIRCSDHQALDFGKWKGAVAAMVRENPPEDSTYMINTRGDEIAEIVANTLCEGAAVWVKGI